MASLVQLVADGFVRTINIVKSVRDDLNGKIGDRTALTTTAKSSLVAALNEVKADMASLSQIDDTTQSGTKTYSSNKIVGLINTAVNNLINGAGSDADTLKELADKITAVAQADAGLVSAVASQSFTAAQQLQARTNIGAAAAADMGDITGVDFVATINTAFANGA